jgi:hypothetical protein
LILHTSEVGILFSREPQPDLTLFTGLPTRPILGNPLSHPRNLMHGETGLAVEDDR